MAIHTLMLGQAGTVFYTSFNQSPARPKDHNMSEQDRTEIRTIIREEIEAKFSTSAQAQTRTKEKSNEKTFSEKSKAINIETVSPAY
jgi:hypothetical protein